jgi:hypothetical protein
MHAEEDNFEAAMTRDAQGAQSTTMNDVEDEVDHTFDLQLEEYHVP